jgi:hypothetical protein
MFVISGILVLLATATIAASYNVQTAKVAANLTPFRKVVSELAKAGKGGAFGDGISDFAHLFCNTRVITPACK